MVASSSIPKRPPVVLTVIRPVRASFDEILVAVALFRPKDVTMIDFLPLIRAISLGFCAHPTTRKGATSGPDKSSTAFATAVRIGWPEANFAPVTAVPQSSDVATLILILMCCSPDMPSISPFIANRVSLFGNHASASVLNCLDDEVTIAASLSPSIP